MSDFSGQPWSDEQIGGFPAPASPPGIPTGASQYASPPPTPPLAPRPQAVYHHAQAPHMPPQQVVARNPGLAGFFSALITGGGQFYNGQIALGLILMVIQVINFVLMFVLIGFLTGFATWGYSIYQAYNEARRFNTAHGIIS